MAYDPQGSGAASGDLLVRRGVSWESVQRLARQAAVALAGGTARNKVPFGHGISMTSLEANQRIANDPTDAVQATRRAFEEAGFEVRFTPTDNDTDHHSVQLPDPVTDEVAVQFNTILGRKRGRRVP